MLWRWWCQVFWGLDKKLAQRKHFPSLNWLISYTKYMRVLEPFFNDYNPDYGMLRNRVRDILQQEDALSEIVQLVGRDSLSEDQKVSQQHDLHCSGSCFCAVQLSSGNLLSSVVLKHSRWLI